MSKMLHSLKIFNDSDLEKIHSATLKILKEVGVKFPNEEVLEIFKENGAIVDNQKKVVQMPEELVERMLKEIISKSKSYYDKYFKYDSKKHYDSIMTLGNLQHVIDYENYNRRRAKLLDVIKSIVVGNELSYDRVSCYFSPEGYEGAVLDIIQHYLLFLFSKKRVFKNQMHSGAESAKCLIEMVKIVADNSIQLRNGTLVEFEMEPVKNLEFSEKSLAAAVEFSKSKMKVLTTQWCWMGYHTPMTIAGACTVANTNIIAGMIALQLLNPDNLFFDYIFATHCMKKNDTRYPLFGSPNQALFAVAAKQIADFYGFPYCLHTSSVSDSIENNFQAGYERGVINSFAVLSGVSNIGVKGIIGRDQGGSLEQLIIDDEMNSYLRFVLGQEIKVDNETIDFNSIKDIGIGGNFQDHPKTIERLKDSYWDSEIFINETYDTWEKGLSLKIIKEKIIEILSKNYPPGVVISEEKVKKLDKILKIHLGNKIFDRFKNELKEALK